MINSIHERRTIPLDELNSISNKLMHPKDALRHNLVDSISTFEEFKALNFPNAEV